MERNQPRGPDLPTEGPRLAAARARTRAWQMARRPAGPPPKCHPARAHVAKGLCGECYNAQRPERQTRRGPRPVTEKERGIMVGLRAAGVPTAAAAAALGRNPTTVRDALSRGGETATVAALRTELKMQKITRAHALEPKLWARAEHEVDTGTAKDVDAIMRALLASEKIQAAAAGEGNASGAPVAGSGPPMELAVLIQLLLDES